MEKATNKMTILELEEEKSRLESLEKKTTRDKSRLKKIQNEIKKKANKISVSDSFANDELKDKLQLKFVYIKDIVMPEYNDRTGIDRHKIKELAASISNRGLIQNPILKDLGNGKYEKIVGRRRILATKLLDEDKVLAKILPPGLSQEEEDMIVWDENQHREDLSVFDKIRFHLQLIKREFNLDSQEAASTLVHNCNYFKKQKDDTNEENKQKVSLLEGIIDRLGEYKTISSLANNLQVLNFSGIILEAIKNNKINFKLAQELNKSLKKLISIGVDEAKVNESIEYIVNNDFSVSEAKEYLQEKHENDNVDNKKGDTFKDTIKELNKTIKSIKKEDKESFSKELKRLISKYKIN